MTDDLPDTPVYEALKRLAASQALTTYSEIAPLAKLDMDSPVDRDAMRNVLGRISTYEHRHGRPMLSAIVVHKQDKHPGRGLLRTRPAARPAEAGSRQARVLLRRGRARPRSMEASEVNLAAARR